MHKIVVCAKILERVIMYYLQAKKRIDDAERLTEAALQRAEQERQLRLQLEQQLRTERQRAEAAEQRVEQEHQLSLQLEQQRQAERQRAEAAENRKPHP